MALAAAGTIAKPDLFCLGSIKAVGDAYTSAKGVYEVLPIEIEGKFAGRDATFYLIYLNEFFSPTFDPNELLGSPEGEKFYGVYQKHVADKKGRATLQVIAGENFDTIAEELGKLEEPTAKDITQILRSNLVGNEVGYVLQQGTEKDDEGNVELTDRYNVQYFFAASDEGIGAMEKAAKNPKRRRGNAVVTWDEA